VDYCLPKGRQVNGVHEDMEHILEGGVCHEI
jgi:hypothetical protein